MRPTLDEYRQQLRTLSNRELVERAGSHILSAAVLESRAPGRYSWDDEAAGACYDEARRRGNPDLREDMIEEMRWSVAQYTFATPEEFESRMGERWREEGTRNHGTWNGGIQREERTDDEAIEVSDENTLSFAAVLCGRTIVAVHREPRTEAWEHGQNSVTLTLDDGSQVGFEGWGYDASGLHTSYAPRRGRAA
jgi:hypothetical protein